MDAHRTRGLDLYVYILLWPPKYAHEWPLQAAWFGCRNVGGTPRVGFHRPLLVNAPRTHAPFGVWTSMATYLCGHPSTRPTGQCRRRSWDAELSTGPLTLVCTHHARCSRRGRTPHAWFGLLWPDTSMATQVRPRMVNARGAVGMQKCWRDPRRRFAPTTPGARVVDARTTWCVAFFGHTLLWPPRYAREWTVQAAWLGCRNVGGTSGVGLHATHAVVAPWTHTVRVVWTSMTGYFYGHPRTRTIVQCKRCGWDAQMLGGPPASVCTHHTRWSRRRRTPYAWFGLPWPDACMATQVRARMATASGAVGM